MAEEKLVVHDEYIIAFFLTSVPKREKKGLEKYTLIIHLYSVLCFHYLRKRISFYLTFFGDDHSYSLLNYCPKSEPYSPMRKAPFRFPFNRVLHSYLFFSDQ